MAKREKKTKYNVPQQRKSFYDFSQSYAGGLNGNRLSYSEKVKRRRIVKWVLSFAGIAVIFVVAFIFTNVMLDISQKPVETTAAAQTGKTTVPAVTEPAAEEIKIHAVSANAGIIDGGQALDNIIALAKSSPANAVVIDFMDSNGYLAYKTSLTAVPKASAYAHTAVKASIDALQAEQISVIARINCFKDPLAAWAMRSAAVHYMGNSGMLWLDNSLANSGHPWLNPYSKEATGYLTGIIKEVAGLGVDYIMLDTVQFPGLNLALATFDGEKTPGAPSRNAVLINFINAAVTSAGKTKIICDMDAAAALNGKSALYSGDLWASSAQIFAVDIRNVPASTPLTFPADKRVAVIVADASKTKSADYIIIK
jgi:hypothetical protein